MKNEYFGITFDSSTDQFSGSPENMRAFALKARIAQLTEFGQIPVTVEAVDGDPKAIRVFPTLEREELVPA